VGPRTGLDDVEKRKFLTLPGLELRPLRRLDRSQSLYRLNYPDSSSQKYPATCTKLDTLSPQAELTSRYAVWYSPRFEGSRVQSFVIYNNTILPFHNSLTLLLGTMCYWSNAASVASLRPRELTFIFSSEHLRVVNEV
jgi:hypothetical protein